VSVYIRDGRREDLETILPRTPETHGTTSTIGSFEFSASFVKDEAPIGIAGVNRIWDGVGEAWSYFSAEMVAEYPLSLTKAGCYMLDSWMDEAPFRILFALTPDTRSYVGWLELLGFKKQYVIKEFGPGSNEDFAWMERRI